MDVFDAMAAAGWAFEEPHQMLPRHCGRFVKDDLWVTYEQAERALLNAQYGISVAQPANDAEGDF